MYDNVAAASSTKEKAAAGAAGKAANAGAGAGSRVGVGTGARAAGADSTIAPASASAPTRTPASNHHRVAMKWFHEYHSKNYMLRDNTGKLVAATMYYDPVLDYNHALDAKMGLGVAWYTLPQSPELARAMSVPPPFHIFSLHALFLPFLLCIRFVRLPCSAIFSFLFNLRLCPRD